MSALSDWMRKHVKSGAPQIPSPIPAKSPPPMPPHPEEPDEPMVSDEEMAAGTAAVRKAVNSSGYGSWVKDEYCAALAHDVLVDAAKVRHKNA